MLARLFSADVYEKDKQSFVSSAEHSMNYEFHAASKMKLTQERERRCESLLKFAASKLQSEDNSESAPLNL